MQTPAEAGNADPKAVAHLRVEGHSRLGVGNLLNRTRDYGQTGIAIAHGSLACGSIERNRLQCREDVPGQKRGRHKVTGKHRAADQSFVVVTVIIRGDTGPGAYAVLNYLFEQGSNASVGVALQMTPNLIAIVADPMWLLRRRTVEKKPGCLNGSCSQHNLVRHYLKSLDRPFQIGHKCHTVDRTFGISKDLLSLNIDKDIATP